MTDSSRWNVFFSFNCREKHKPWIEEISEWLEARGVKVWMDMWESPPGSRWWEKIEKAIGNCIPVVVFIGPGGIGPWGEIEMRAALSGSLRRKSPLIPVLLPGCPDISKIPTSLDAFQFVDFRDDLDDKTAKEKLYWGVTGMKPPRDGDAIDAAELIIDRPDRPNKIKLLKKVDQQRIRLHGSGRSGSMEFVKELKESLVERPRGRRPRDQILSPDVKLMDVFDDEIGVLLILGAPEVNQTHCFLEISRDLISRAKNDHGQPIPVILDLSSWNSRWSSMADWFCQELNIRYQIFKSRCREWVNSPDDPHLLYMLIGIDKIKPGYRGACIQTINAFHEAYGLSRMVIAMGRDAYQSSGVKLKAEKAIVLNPARIHEK